MSHSTRQKRGKSRSAKRRESNSHPARWYLTIGTRASTCGEPGCDHLLRRGTEVVYRHEPREILCLTCADRRGIKYRPSLRWEEANVTQGGKRKQRRPPPGSKPQAARPPDSSPAPTRAEIEAARHTRENLAAWGVPWPPPKGWRRRLLREADRRDGTSPPTPPAVRSSDVDRDDPRVREGQYGVGELHRARSEWTWDGSAFARTSEAA